MAKYYKFFEYAYLVIAIVFLIETVLNWNTEPQKSYIYLAFSVVAVFMYFFRKKFRKKFENHNHKK